MFNLFFEHGYEIEILSNGVKLLGKSLILTDSFENAVNFVTNKMDIPKSQWQKNDLLIITHLESERKQAYVWHAKRKKFVKA